MSIFPSTCLDHFRVLWAVQVDDTWFLFTAPWRAGSETITGWGKTPITPQLNGTWTKSTTLKRGERNHYWLRSFQLLDYFEKMQPSEFHLQLSGDWEFLIVELNFHPLSRSLNFLPQSLNFLWRLLNFPPQLFPKFFVEKVQPWEFHFQLSWEWVAGVPGGGRHQTILSTCRCSQVTFIFWKRELSF